MDVEERFIPKSDPPREVSTSIAESLLSLYPGVQRGIEEQASESQRDEIVEKLIQPLLSKLPQPAPIDDLYVTPIHFGRFDSGDRSNTRLLVHIYNFASPPLVPASLAFEDAGLVGTNKHWYGVMDVDLPDRIDAYALTVGGAAMGYLYFSVPIGVALDKFVMRVEARQSEEPIAAVMRNYVWDLDPTKTRGDQDER